MFTFTWLMLVLYASGSIVLGASPADSPCLVQCYFSYDFSVTVSVTVIDFFPVKLQLQLFFSYYYSY